VRLASIATALLLAFLALSLAPAPAAADDARTQAKEHFAKGKKHLDAKEYDAAIVEYQTAYDLVPIPELLFNIGQAYRLKGDKLRAYDAYQKYLDVEPNGRGSKEARKHMASLRKGAGEQRKAEEAEAARKAEEDRKAEAARKAEEARRAEELRRKTEAELDEPMPMGGDPREERKDRPPSRRKGRAGGGLRIGGIVTAGLGVALVGGGVYFGLRASDLQSQGEERLAGGQWDPEVANIIEDGKAAERNMLILTIAGGAAIITGGVMYYLGYRAGERSTAVAIAPTHGGAALVIGGSW
jgi:tetratricopeptide (TPR) repeat protein